MHIVCFVCCFIYYFNCISFAIRLSGRKVAIKLIDWLIEVFHLCLLITTTKVLLCIATILMVNKDFQKASGDILGVRQASHQPSDVNAQVFSGKLGHWRQRHRPAVSRYTESGACRSMVHIYVIPACEALDGCRRAIRSVSAYRSLVLFLPFERRSLRRVLRFWHLRRGWAMTAAVCLSKRLPASPHRAIGRDPFFYGPWHD